MILASNYRYCVEGGIIMPRKSTQTTAIEPSEQTAVDLGLIVLKDGQHQDDAAEREAMERGQAASKRRRSRRPRRHRPRRSSRLAPGESRGPASAGPLFFGDRCGQPA